MNNKNEEIMRPSIRGAYAPRVCQSAPSPTGFEVVGGGADHHTRGRVCSPTRIQSDLDPALIRPNPT